MFRFSKNFLLLTNNLKFKYFGGWQFELILLTKIYILTGHLRPLLLIFGQYYYKLGNVKN